jgi:hypothetical protein
LAFGRHRVFIGNKITEKPIFFYNFKLYKKTMPSLKKPTILPLKKIAENNFSDQIGSIIPTHKGEWIVTFKNKPEVVKLDAKLQTLWERNYNAQSQAYVSTSITLDPTGNCMAISTRETITIKDNQGSTVFEIKHKAWESFNGSQNFFTTDGQYFINLLPFAHQGDDLLQIRTLPSFDIIQEISVPCGYSYYYFYGTSNPSQVIISPASGQDESPVYILTIDNQKATLKEWHVCYDLIIGNLSHNGNQVITTLHYGSTIQSIALQDNKVVTIITEAEVFEDNPEEEPDGFEYAKYIGPNDLIIIKSRNGQLIAVNSQTKTLLGALVPEGLTPMDMVIDYCIDNSKILINHNSTTIALYEIAY